MSDPSDAVVSEQDFQRACAHHLYTLPWRRMLGTHPSFPMTTEQVRKALALLGYTATGELLDSLGAMQKAPPDVIKVWHPNGVEEARTFWRASNVILVIAQLQAHDELQSIARAVDAG